MLLRCSGSVGAAASSRRFGVRAAPSATPRSRRRRCSRPRASARHAGSASSSHRASAPRAAGARRSTDCRRRSRASTCNDASTLPARCWELLANAAPSMLERWERARPTRRRRGRRHDGHRRRRHLRAVDGVVACPGRRAARRDDELRPPALRDVQGALHDRARPVAPAGGALPEVRRRGVVRARPRRRAGVPVRRRRARRGAARRQALRARRARRRRSAGRQVPRLRRGVPHHGYRVDGDVHLLPRGRAGAAAAHPWRAAAPGGGSSCRPAGRGGKRRRSRAVARPSV